MNQTISNPIIQSILHRSVLNGRITEYWPNGMIRVTGNYISGQKMDEWVYFDSDGEVVYKVGWMIHLHTNAKSFIYYECDYLKAKNPTLK